MPEALAIVFVFVVAGSAYIGARLNAANPRLHNAHTERERLRTYRIWLQARLELADREKWEPDMRARLAEELKLTESQLVKRGIPLTDRS